jgi:hypothetical protein
MCSRRLLNRGVRPLKPTVRHPMNRAAAVILMATYAAVAFAEPDFDSLLAAVKTQSATSSSPISLTATGSVEGADLLLRFHLTNVSKAPLTFLNHNLPWGDPYSVKWVAYTNSGRALPRAAITYTLVSGGRTTVPVGAGVDGSYRLNWLLKMDSVSPDSDLMIVWAYVPPRDASPLPRSVSSGVTGFTPPNDAAVCLPMLRTAVMRETLCAASTEQYCVLASLIGRRRTAAQAHR